MIYLCSVAFLFGVFFAYVKRYNNPYLLYLVFGKKGSGKSTFLVKTAYRYLKRGWAVYTNMTELNMPGVRHIDIEQLGAFVPVENSCCLLDEVGMIWDSRDFKRFKPEVRDFFKLQRHYRVVVYMASQTFDVDKKIRDLCDGMFLHVCLGKVFTLGKRITRKVVLTEASADGESRISENLAFCPFWYWTWTYIPKWAKFYNSHAVPQRPTIPYYVDPPWEKKERDFISLFSHRRRRRRGRCV